jgi:hypothetical protein
MRSVGGFHAHKIKFLQENDEIFMNPPAELGISPIAELYTQQYISDRRS